LFGYLAGPECRRAIARGWLLVVRGLAGTGLALIALLLVWYWWLNAGFDPNFVPSGDVQIALATAAMILLTVDVVMVPAVLAGSLAGERERGVLQLLLTTAASAREIVLGRLIGKLSQVAMILMAGVPVVAFLGAWSGFRLEQLAEFLLLLASVGVGGGGLAALASVVSRRGRDALLGVYLVILILYLSPLLERLGLPAEIADWLSEINPYVSLASLVWYGHAGRSLVTSAIWLVVGLAGTAIATWRLRPSCLASTEKVKKGRRPRWVPPINDSRPMLWKELYVEHVGTLGRFGRWLGVILTLGVGGVSLGLAAIIVWGLFVRQDSEWSDWGIMRLGGLLDESGLLLGWLLQWAIGLRAAVSIASERERGTWDALLVTPLEPVEIVIAKLLGSLNALRFMAGALVLAWTLGVATTAVTPAEYAKWMIGTLTAAALMAAVGVRCSLSTSTATRAMTWTISWWLILLCGVAIVTLSIILLGLMTFVFAWIYFLQLGWIPMGTAPWFPMSFELAWNLSVNTINLLITIVLVAEMRLRFDRLAGRIPEGAAASAVDDWLYGHQLQPVFLPEKARRAEHVLPPASEVVTVLEASPSEVDP
jgi:ABC-type Na+ efflux pump permease subunit